MDEYEQEAQQFLKETNTEFKAEFLKNGFHFQDDKEPRDIYLITLKRGEREFKFNFGQSLNNSGKYISLITQNFKNPKDDKEDLTRGQSLTEEEYKKIFWKIKRDFGDIKGIIELNKNFEIPSAYDVLAGLTCSEVGDFKNFCDDFGYDTDSRKAEKTYKAVLEEWNNIKMLYTDEEILKLQEIQ